MKQAENPLTLEQFKASPESYFQGYLTLQQTVADLVFQLGNLQRQVYGSKSEKRPLIDPDQILLGLPVPAIELPVVELQTQQISYSKTTGKKEKITHPGRMTFPAHLNRDVIIVDPQGKQDDWKLIGQEVTEELDYTPAILYVRQTIRNKYSTRSEGIVIGEPLEQVLPKAMAGPALLAQILIDKYADHLPIYRQIERFKRMGVTLAASTISGWIGACCDLILPLHDAIRKQVLQSGYIQADESPIKVLDKDKKGSTHQGYYWVFHSPPQGLVLFDYQKGRSAKLGLDWMESYQGYLQTDGYAGYDAFVSKAGIIHLSCLAHARRYFEQAEGNDPQRVRKAMAMIQQIYALERTAKDQGYTPVQLLALRQEKALPVWLELKTWLLRESTLILPKSPIGKAILYTLSRINPLMVYLSDARLLPDNNLVENTIRPLAIGRKNYLFAGSHQAAQRGAILYSLIGCCKRHGINPLTYFTDTLIRIGSHSILRINELLPDQTGNHRSPITLYLTRVYSGRLQKKPEIVKSDFAICTCWKAYKTEAVSFTSSMFIVFILAFLFSMCYLLYLFRVKKIKFAFINVLCGWILGVANFGNILFYLKAHQTLAQQPSLVFSAMNIGVILLGSVVGVLIFHEKLSRLNYAGIVLALISIGLMSVA